MSFIHFLSSFLRDRPKRSVPGRYPVLSSRTPRLESLESRLQLSASPVELAFDTFPQHQVAAHGDAVDVSHHTTGGDIASSAPTQVSTDPFQAETLNGVFGNQAVADSLVCYPVESAGVAARVDALMEQLAQIRPIASAPIGAILGGMGPWLSVVDLTLPMVLGGEGELTSGHVGDPPPPEPLGDPLPPGDPGDPIGGPQIQLPVITEFSVVAGVSNVWFAEGQVEHDMPWTLTIVFGGLFEGHSTSVNTDGSFSYGLILPAGTTGLVSAQAFDQFGGASEIEYDYIH